MFDFNFRSNVKNKKMHLYSNKFISQYGCKLKIDKY
jgi:hypothetical protein